MIIPKNKLFIIFIILASGLLLLGLEIIMIGIPYVISAINLETPTCETELRCLSYKLSYKIPIKNGTDFIQMSGDIFLSSEEVFAVDNPINYKIKLSTSDNVEQIFFIIGSNDEDYSILTETSPEAVLADAKIHRKLIDMQKTSPNMFTREGFWTHPLEHEIVFVGVVINNEHEAVLIPKSQILLNLKPYSDFADADARNRAEISDSTIQGLTWIGVGAIPAWIGVDIFLRIFLRESAVDRWFNTKSENGGKSYKDHYKIYR